MIPLAKLIRRQAPPISWPLQPGAYHSLALQQDGAVLGWGDDTAGQCDPPKALTNAVAIAAGGITVWRSLRTTGGSLGRRRLRADHVPPGLDQRDRD